MLDNIRQGPQVGVEAPQATEPRRSSRARRPVDKLNLLVKVKGLDALQREVEAEEEMSSDEEEEVVEPQESIEQDSSM